MAGCELLYKMLYTRIDKGNGEETIITREEALSTIQKDYNNAAEVLQANEALMAGKIVCTFAIISTTTI